jgi:hypothetical protein
LSAGIPAGEPVILWKIPSALRASPIVDVPVPAAFSPEGADDAQHEPLERRIKTNEGRREHQQQHDQHDPTGNVWHVASKRRNEKPL